MAGTDWATRNPVATDLLKNASSYSFFEAVRLLQEANEEAPRIGHQGPPERECVRLRPKLDFDFPLSDLAGVVEAEQPDGSLRYTIEVAFLGLYGTSSPLPSHYTEDMIRREEYEGLLRGFLDIFHHRLLSLLYRAWEKYRYVVQYDAAGRDYYSRRLLGALGAAIDLLPQDAAVRPGRILCYAGLLTQIPRSAETIRSLLQNHFPESPVQIEQCIGIWSEIPRDQVARLGAANSSFGSTMLGTEVFNRTGGFGVRVGPMAIDSYLDMLPGESDQDQLRELVDLLNNDGLEYELTLILRGDEVPQAQLNSPRTRLGWCSWLGESRGEDRSVTFRFKGWKHGRG